MGIHSDLLGVLVKVSDFQLEDGKLKDAIDKFLEVLII